VVSASIFFSSTHNLPELYFTVHDELGNPVKDAEKIVLGYREMPEKHLLLTKKEHPVENKVSFYLHEC